MHLAAMVAAAGSSSYHHPNGPLLALAGFLGGIAVGLTGMGGGALMTPLLVLVFRVSPQVAIASDLVGTLVMKPVGGSVHARRGTIHWALVRWLVVGSVPAALAGAFVLNHLGHAGAVQRDVKELLGWALLVACASMITKHVLGARAASRREVAREQPNPVPYLVKPGPTVLVGALGGFMVGLTSVGSGSLMIVLLMLLYPRLSSRSLVGTDLVQAVPLVASAAVGQLVWGHVDFGLAGALLIGSIPGAYLGARISSRAPDRIVRPLLVFILISSALSLLLGNNVHGLAWALLIVVATGIPLSAAVDATLRRSSDWRRAGYRRTTWVTLLGIGAPLGIGLVAVLPYLVRVRPAVRRAEDDRREPAPATPAADLGGGRAHH